MSRKSLLLCLTCLPVWGQNANTPALEAQAAALRALVAQAPTLALERTQIKIQAPGAGWELGYPSAVTMDEAGTIYALQRGEKADPVLVLNRDGKIIRSWGKGMYKIPHSIRIDSQGNIWTVDSSSSMVLKFTPQGEKLMEISVGEQPAGRGATNGTTDIAFGPNGRLFISDGYGNARVLEYTSKGERVRQWGSAGTGPGQFRQPHGIAVDDQGIIYVADRQNARLQRFDLNGKYLGEWDDLGRVTTVTFRDGTLWIGTQFNNESNESDGWHMKIDRKTGKILGYAVSGHSHHILNVTKSGDLLAGARPDIIWWFHKAH
jgi:DNA-binding beta-propeller fold protein YncE